MEKRGEIKKYLFKTVARCLTALRNRPTDPCTLARMIQYDLAAAGIGALGGIIGSAPQGWKYDGVYIFPEFFRYHFADLFPAFALTGMANGLQLGAPHRSFTPVANIAVPLLLGVALEVAQAFWPGRSLDLVDIGAGALGLACYLCHRQHYQQQLETGIVPPEYPAPISPGTGAPGIHP